MNRSYLIATLILAAAIAWVVSGQVTAPASSSATGAAVPGAGTPSPAAALPPLVRVATLSAQPMVDAVVLQGRTQAARRVNLKAEIRGRVEEVPIPYGRPVRAGDVIARFAVEHREADRTQAEALLLQRQVEYDAARVLAAKGFNSEITLAQARTAYEAAQATLRRAVVELENTVIRAPFDGVLDRRPVEVGDFLDINREVATVVELDPLRVVGAVAERAVARLHRGLRGTVRTADGQEREGVVRYVSASADPATRTFAVEVEIPNPEPRLHDGLTAQIRLPLETRPAHRVSPALLTLADDGAIGVKRVDSENRVHFQPVELLGQAADGVWIGGLPPEVTVITVGQDFVSEGQEVRIASGS